MVQTKMRRLLWLAAALVFWLAVWHVAALFIGREIILPTPFAVFRRLAELVRTAPLWKATALSLLRILGGFVIGLIAGAMLGAGMYFARPVRIVFSPFLTVVKSTPVASFILVAYFIISDNVIPVFITFLMVLPMIASTVFTSLSSTDKALLEMTSVYKFSFSQKLKNLYIPTVLPHFLGQALTALGLGWKAGIAAEVLCTPRDSIGKYLYSAKTYLETVDTFAYTLLIILISLCLEKMLKKLLSSIGGAA